MKFVIRRASRKPIGDEYTLVHRWEDENIYHRGVEHGIIEIKSLEELPKEEFVLDWSISAYAHIPSEINLEDIDGQIVLYDDYLE